jgi:4-hydroxy-tetrahydrodipicolinate reductase
MNIALVGASGKTGSEIARLAPQRGAQIVCAVANEDSLLLGVDLGERLGLGRWDVPIQATLDCTRADVVVDMSSPEATAAALELSLQHKLPFLTGTTGLSEALQARLSEAAAEIPVIHSANMSLGVHLLANLVRIAAQALPKNFEIELVEKHHRQKKDSPSGTALLLAEAAANARNLSLSQEIQHGREGIVGPRSPSEIGVHAVRGGTVIGEHEVFFFGDAEQISLRHQAENRSVFASGALTAAAWLTKQPAGRYTIKDVLGL